MIVPLFPEGSPEVDVTQAVMYWQYRTINRDGKGSKSLFTLLRERCPKDFNLDNYITFFALFQHGKINDKVVGSQIYVHSKILIVDDDLMIVGSQNINDRSLLGSRDSEIALKITNDQNTEQVSFSGITRSVSKIVRNFRLALWSEHLQIFPENELYKDLLDPTTDNCYHQLWRNTAKKNTDILDRVFPTKPSDLIDRNAVKFEPHLSNPERVDTLNEVRGHHILFPLEYLKKQHNSMRHALTDLMFQ